MLARRCLVNGNGRLRLFPVGFTLLVPDPALEPRSETTEREMVPTRR